MESIQIALQAALPAFANDFCDVLKLFYQVEDYQTTPDAAGEPLIQQYEETDGKAVCTFAFRGETLRRIG